MFGTSRQLYLLQRLSAMVLAPLVIVHLLLILYAVQNGLTADEILSRTKGSLVWGIFYTVFVLSVAIHAPIGLRTVMVEWTGLSKSVVNVISIILFLLFLVLGLRAVFAVI